MKKCTKCSSEGIDTLFYGSKEKRIKGINLPYGVENQRFCRRHLLEVLGDEFLKYEGKLVVFHPDLSVEDKSVQYAYANLEVGHNFFDSKKLNEKIETAFEKIENKTCTCGAPAQVAYYPKGTFEWETFGKWYQVKWTLPVLEDAIEPADILCLKCAYDRISLALNEYSGHLDEGLSTPYGKRGIYFPTQI